VVILSSLIRKKASELPFLAKDDLIENGDDLYFCSCTCYMQFALMHRSPSVSEDKVSSLHICMQRNVHVMEVMKHSCRASLIVNMYLLACKLYSHTCYTPRLCTVFGICSFLKS
jgi:hypothetical protein